MSLKRSLMTILSQLSSVQTIREAHLQVGSAVWTAARREADGHPAGRRRGVPDHPLIEGGGSQILSQKQANEYQVWEGGEKNLCYQHYHYEITGPVHTKESTFINVLYTNNEEHWSCNRKISVCEMRLWFRDPMQNSNKQFP